MSVIWLWLWGVTVVVAFAFGIWHADSTARRYLKAHRFCPTCEQTDFDSEVR